MVLLLVVYNNYLISQTESSTLPSKGFCVVVPMGKAKLAYTHINTSLVNFLVPTKYLHKQFVLHCYIPTLWVGIALNWSVTCCIYCSC